MFARFFYSEISCSSRHALTKVRRSLLKTRRFSANNWINAREGVEGEGGRTRTTREITVN